MKLEALGETLIVRVEKKSAKEPKKLGNLLITTQPQPEDNYDTVVVESAGRDVLLSDGARLLITVYAGKVLPSDTADVLKLIRKDEIIAYIQEG